MKLAEEPTVVCGCGRVIVAEGQVHFHCGLCGGVTEKSIMALKSFADLDLMPYISLGGCCNDEVATICGEEDEKHLTVKCVCGIDHHFEI